jgi:hypothetical protein
MQCPFLSTSGQCCWPLFCFNCWMSRSPWLETMDGSNVGCRIRNLHPFLLASRPSSSSFLQFLLPPLIKPRDPRPSVTKYYHFFPPMLVIEYEPLSFISPSELLQHAAGPLGYSPVHPFSSTLLVVKCKVSLSDQAPILRIPSKLSSHLSQFYWSYLSAGSPSISY